MIAEQGLDAFSLHKLANRVNSPSAHSTAISLQVLTDRGPRDLGHLRDTDAISQAVELGRHVR